jgi:hypothetical protein
MATAPGRGAASASPTASVTALLRVPGGAEVLSGFGIRERLIALTVLHGGFMPGGSTGIGYRHTGRFVYVNFGS